MPIYEYQCQNCHRTLEKRQKFSDEALTVCPFCAGPLEKLISAPAVQFKGGGWYADGYGNKSAAKSSSSSEGSSSPSATAGSSDSSTSTTPASTPASTASSTPASTTSTTSSK